MEAKLIFAALAETPLAWTFRLLGPGVAGLEEVHMAAQGDRQETREELDSLLNLMARLDFNHFFSEPPQLSSLLGSPL